MSAASEKKAKAKAKTEKTKDYEVLTEGAIIEGEVYEAGEVASLTDEEVAALQAGGVAVTPYTEK